MNIFNKIYLLFNSKAKQKSQFSVTQQKPNIIYSYRIINSQNIDLYKSGQESFVGGRHGKGSNDIIVYRYVLDEDLHLPENDFIVFSIKFVKEFEQKTILHETKHWQNDKLGNPMFLATNYYELAGMYIFDEVSAYTTGFIKSYEKEKIYSAIYEAINCFIDSKSKYIPTYMARIENKIILDCMGQDFNTIKKRIEENLTPKYSFIFNKTVSEYFIFNDQEMFYQGAPVPVELKKKLKELRMICEESTKQTMLKILTLVEQSTHNK